MPKAACSDEEFIRLFKDLGPQQLARQLGIAVRAVMGRRVRLEKKFEKIIEAPGPQKGLPSKAELKYPARAPLTIQNGVVIVGSDAHFWPDEISTAFRGLLFLARELQPTILGLNGDVVDGARISRHPPIGWSYKPTVKQELETVDLRLEEIRAAVSQDCTLFWNLGNHCMRFENRLAGAASEFEDVAGFCLKDHFPAWKINLSTWINDGELVLKHRYKGGVHATHNNTVNSGKSMLTGHLHSLKVTPFSDYNGTRWGIDTGTLADPYGAQFEYSEDNPLNHRSGFVVLTFHNGKLLWPEIARVVDETHIDFRGKLIAV